LKSIAAIVVTFHPKAEMIDGLVAIASSVKHSYVIDNGSSLHNEFLREVEKLPNTTLIRLGHNLGIASALNVGVKHALASDVDWVLTLDQDTLLTSEAIDKMMEAYELYPNQDQIGILAPTHFEKNMGPQKMVGSKGNDVLIPREHVISSGCLIPRSTFDRVSGFDEDLFIDMVDHDFCLKVRKSGLEVFMIGNAQMAHSLGASNRHKFGPLSFFSHNYPVERQYYRARNRIVLYRRHFGAWVWRDQQFAIKDLTKVLLVESNKWKKIKAILHGTRDGLVGRMGPYRREI
jgi:rhamnosyltransferase